MNGEEFAYDSRDEALRYARQADRRARAHTPEGATSYAVIALTHAVLAVQERLDVLIDELVIARREQS